jgi:hypothetical protein
MSHVHGAAANGAAQLGKSAAKAAGQGMTGEGMSGMMGEMMKQGMMGQAANFTPAAASFHNLAKGAAASGAAATASSTTGRSFVGKLLRHPLVLFGLGVAVGYAIHKYRKEIIDSASRAAETSKDFVLQQRENLEDLVAETQQPET